MQVQQGKRGAVNSRMVVIAIILVAAAGLIAWQMSSRDDRPASSKPQTTFSDAASVPTTLAAGYSEQEKTSYIQGCTAPTEGAAALSDSECTCMFNATSHAMSHDKFVDATSKLSAEGGDALPAYYTKAQATAISVCTV